MSALSAVTASINAALAAGIAGVDERERSAALAAVEHLRAALQSTGEAVTDIAFAAHKMSAVRIGMGMGIFNAMAAAEGSIMTIDELSKRTGVNAFMIVRVMRMLVAMRMFEEKGPNTYESLPLGGAFVDGSPWADGVTHVGVHEEALVKLPAYLESTNYATPNDAFNGPWQYAMQTELHHFDWLKTHPKLQAAFNSIMAIRRRGRGEEWFDFFPVAEKLRVKSPDDVMLVDIGGGRGHDLIDFHTRHINLPGKLILQDLPVAINDIRHPLPAGIEAQRYDFFTRQPVRGAKAYYLRTVLHDWPDKQALQILGNVREAMGKESVLLVNENCLSEQNVPMFEAQTDFTMMVLFASLERTEVQWRRLLEAGGFKVVGVHRPSEVQVGSGTLIEAVAA